MLLMKFGKRFNGLKNRICYFLANCFNPSARSSLVPFKKGDSNLGHELHQPKNKGILRSRESLFVMLKKEVV